MFHRKLTDLTHTWKQIRMNQYKYLKLDVKEGLAFVTLNNPPVNLLKVELFEEIKNMTNQVKNNRDIKVWILTAAGQRCFSVGVEVLCWL